MKPINNGIGQVDCPNMGCGEVAEVRQSNKAGRYFYLVCPSCKVNQQTGDPIQNYIWHRATWNPGAEVLKPSNITDAWQSPEPSPAPPDPVPPDPVPPDPVPVEQQPATGPDYCPLSDKDEPAPTSPPVTSKGASPRVIVGTGLLISAVVGAIWTAI